MKKTYFTPYTENELVRLSALICATTTTPDEIITDPDYAPIRPARTLYI